MGSTHIGIWGDSISVGFKDEEHGGWVTRLQIYLMKGKNYSITYNCGINGCDSSDVLERFDFEAKIRKPNIVIFAIGKNDSGLVGNKEPLVSDDKFEKNLNQLAKQAQSLTKNILFISIGNVDESKTAPFPKGWQPYYVNKQICEYNSIIERVCKNNNLKFIPIYGFLDIKKDLFDGIHPNASGHEKIFRRVLPVVEEMVGEAKNES